MVLKIRRTEGGQGGGRGHGGMDHWEYTEIIKEESNRRRRQQNKACIQEQLDPDDIGNPCRRCGPGPCDPEEHEVDVIAFFMGVDPEELLRKWEKEGRI